MAIQTLARFSDLFGTGSLPLLEDLVFDAYKVYPDLLPKMFKMVKTDKEAYQVSQITGFDVPPVKAHGSEIVMDSMYQGYDKSVTPDTYALGFVASEELVANDRYDLLKEASSQLGKSFFHLRQMKGAELYNNGFATYTVGDGQYLFSTAHPLVGGGTSSNKPSANVDLSVTALKQGFIDFKNMKNHRNSSFKFNLQPKVLLISREQMFTADEILGSSLLADTANNNKNSLGGLGLEVVICDYLTDSDAWFLLVDPSDQKCEFIEHTVLSDLSPMKWYDNKTTSGYMAMRWWGDYIVADWRSVYGSPGA